MQPILLEQIVPAQRCAACDVCCRFPEADSPLRPYFTPEERADAIRHGIAPEAFPAPAGGKINLVPHPEGVEPKASNKEGFICPAFDPGMGRCTIYTVRPLDCRLYPFAVMFDRDRRAVLFGLDTKCPFPSEDAAARGPGPLGEYAERVAAALESDETVALLAAHPDLIGEFQEDVRIIRPLERVTRRVIRPNRPVFRTLQLDDRGELESALRSAGGRLSGFSSVPWFVWRDRLKYRWTRIRDCLCLFAQAGDTYFLPVPPIVEPKASNKIVPKASNQVEAWEEAAIEAMKELDRLNTAAPGASRIENLTADQAKVLEAGGLASRPHQREYLYRTAAIARLAGDNYKSQRWAINRCLRDREVQIEPFRSADVAECLGLFERWRADRAARRPDPYNRGLLADASCAHRTGLGHAAELGLSGIVARIGSRIAGYTLGYPLNPEVFCIMFEVTESGETGLSALIFREFARRLSPYPWLNTMDDADLPALRRAKEADHPAEVLETFSAHRRPD